MVKRIIRTNLKHSQNVSMILIICLKITVFKCKKVYEPIIKNIVIINIMPESQNYTVKRKFVWLKTSMRHSEAKSK